MTESKCKVSLGLHVCHHEEDFSPTRDLLSWALSRPHRLEMRLEHVCSIGGGNPLGHKLSDFFTRDGSTSGDVSQTFVDGGQSLFVLIINERDAVLKVELLRLRHVVTVASSDFRCNLYVRCDREH